MIPTATRSRTRTCSGRRPRSDTCLESRAMARMGDRIRKGPFSFLFVRSRKEEVCAEHLIREHPRGRALEDILQDAYITNRLSPEQAQRLLDRPDVLQAFGDDLVAARRAAGNGGKTV